MIRSVPFIFLALALASAGTAVAAEHQIKMTNTGPDGPMAFDPPYLKAAKGDTVKFVKVGATHSSESLAVPDGATAWKGKMDEEIVVTLDKEGAYLYTCGAHGVMGMVGVIQVGNAGNLGKVKEAAEAFKATKLKSPPGQARLDKYLALVK